MDESILWANARVAESIVTDAKRRSSLLAIAKAGFGIRAGDAEDLIQETALRVVEYANVIRDPAAFFFTVFRNLCTATLRENQVFLRSSFATLDLPDERRGRPLRAEDRIAVREALASISERCRDLLVQHYLYGRKVRDVARAAKLTEGTASRTIGRCLQSLRKALA